MQQLVDDEPAAARTPAPREVSWPAYPGLPEPGRLPAVVDRRGADVECEVLVYDAAGAESWCRGVVAQWRRHEDDTWTAWVRWSSPTGNRIDIIRPDRLRPVQLDWSKGRVAH